MISKKNKKSFLLTLALVSIFHIAVINIGSFNAQKEYSGRGGVVHNIYFGYDSGGAGGENNGDPSEKKKELRKNKNLKKHLKPKSRLISKEEAAKLKSVEEINLDKRLGEEQKAQKLEGNIGFNAGGRGGRDGNGFAGYGRGKSLDQIRLAYLNALKIEIEKNKEYLTIVKSSDQTGIVGISFIILKDGSIIDVKLRERSKYPNLNLLALKLILKLKRFKPIPYELMMERWKIDVDIEYKLGG